MECDSFSLFASGGFSSLETISLWPQLPRGSTRGSTLLSDDCRLSALGIALLLVPLASRQ